jgi:hypothetical protein
MKKKLARTRDIAMIGDDIMILYTILHGTNTSKTTHGWRRQYTMSEAE